MSEYIVRETGYPGTVKQEVIGELVRCAECKHYRSVAGYIDGYCHMAEWYRRYQYPDDYCSRGERKDDATND